MGTWPKFQPADLLTSKSRRPGETEEMQAAKNRRNLEADEEIRRVKTEEIGSSLLSSSSSHFPTTISISFNFCGSFITKAGGCSRFSGRPRYCVVVFKQQVTCDQALFSFRLVKHSGGTGETKNRA